jgi:hypothetical protein
MSRHFYSSLCTGLLFLLVSAPQAWGQECPNLIVSISRINAALDEALLEEASEIASAAQQGLLCQDSPINPPVLAAIFHLSGALNTFLDQESEASTAYAWAASVAPEIELDPMLGSKAQSAYDTERQRILGLDRSRVTLTGDANTWLDGNPLTPGVATEIVAGSHLLQWKLVQESEAVLQARFLEIQPGESMDLDLGEAVPIVAAAPEVPTVEAVEAPSPDLSSPPASRSQTLLLGSGGACALGGAALLFLASRAHTDFDQASDPTELVDLQARTNNLALAGLGLSATGLGLVGTGFFLEEGGLFRATFSF